MSQDPAVLGAMRDEQNYMKNMELQKLNDDKKYREQESLRIKNRNNTNMFLAQQI